MKENYSATELMICLAARIMEDGSTSFIGTGIPMLAASLAQHLQAPNLIAFFEFGGIGARLEKLPLSVAEMRTYNKALHASGLCDLMEAAQRGVVEYGFLGGAQIDQYGNLNTTLIGDHSSPKVRLPGSGGGNDLGSFCWKTIILMKQDKRKFVEKLDFLTTPGYLKGKNSRELAGLPRGTGPFRVVTDLAVMDFEEKSRKMRISGLNPGVTVDEVKANTSFELLVSEDLKENLPPSEEELNILRTKVDLDGLYR